MRRRLTAATVLTAALAVMPVAAQGPGPHSGMVGGPMDAIGPIVHMLQMLDLNDTQKQQIHSLLMQVLQTDDSAQQVRAAEQQLHSAVLADVPDLQAVETVKATLNAVHAAELDRHIDLMLKVAQILTPAQRQQLLKLHPGAGGETK